MIQYPTRSYKLGLLNLENYAWISAFASDLEWVSVLWLRLWLNPLGLWLLKTLLANVLINLKILFLKILRLLELLMFGSRLFRSINEIVDGKKELKMLCFLLKKGIFVYFWYYIQSFLKGLVWKDIAKIHFCRIYKNKIAFCTKDGAGETPNIFFHKISPLKNLLLLRSMQGKDYIVSVLIFDEKLHYKLGDNTWNNNGHYETTDHIWNYTGRYKTKCR